MNQKLLAQYSENLESLLRKYMIVDVEASQLLEALLALLSDARAERIASPLEWGEVPGDYYFDEGGLRRYADLEREYARFKIEITGGESPALRALRNEMRGHDK